MKPVKSALVWPMTWGGNNGIESCDVGNDSNCGCISDGKDSDGVHGRWKRRRLVSSSHSHMS
jgi:hypothetical protein